MLARMRWQNAENSCPENNSICLNILYIPRVLFAGKILRYNSLSWHPQILLHQKQVFIDGAPDKEGNRWNRSEDALLANGKKVHIACSSRSYRQRYLKISWFQVFLCYCRYKIVIIII